MYITTANPFFGGQLYLLSNDKVQPVPEKKGIIGDANGDGVVDILDAIMIQKATVEKVTLTDEQIEVSDVNDDGVVDILDAADVQKFTVDKITEFKKKA